ncbi:MAG: Asparagine synthetase (glutamine-hydrolyzing) 1 [Elusimicrobia bacterium ADurb.Bin231]|nr:MAG: Asparagine synthetase (glutamine-hydrolyzing) 1 [Elusimicrobia bacterium ADurb.Bin231]
MTMCGIAGMFNFNGEKSVKEIDVRKMCDLIKYRGPDSEGVFIHPKTNDRTPYSVGLGIRRLAIIDLATGDQPIHNEDKTIWVVQNGEIYNFSELRSSLEKKHKFYTKTDTEVIAHLYEEYGERCVEHMRGMFAFAVWDSAREKLFVARDRVGKKPLYYAVHNGTFYFGSEIKSILACFAKMPEIDYKALDLFLTYQYIPSPLTVFKGIESLLPAHTLVCDKNGKIEIKKYWDLDFRNKLEISLSGACGELKSLLCESVKLRMISDVPLGAFLSGGHDSSIIVGLMSEFSKNPVKTFTIGFEDLEFSEIEHARRVAEHFKTEHHELIVKPDFIEVLPKLAWHYGQPYADSSALPSYFVAMETRKHVTVALNGDGGDENFGGYLRYKAMKGSLYFSFPFRVLGRNLTNIAASLIPFKKNKKYFRYLYRLVSALSEPPELRNIQWHCFFNREMKDSIYTEEFKSRVVGQDSYDYLADIFRHAPANNIMDKTFYTDIKAYLPECLLVKMDIASMANSLESRSPFLDHKILEFAASLPSSWKVRGITTKYILKKTFKNFLPPEIMRRGKMGFGIPLSRWFRTDWKDYFISTVLSGKACARGYFKRSEVRNLYDEHLSGKRDHGYRLWALLMLELWHKVYIDGEKFDE